MDRTPGREAVELLLPFMLSNLAIWLRPPEHDRWGCPACCAGCSPAPSPSPVMAASAVSVGAAFTATLVYRVADALDHGAIPDPIRPDPPIVGPAGAAGGLLVGRARRVRRRRRRVGDQSAGDLPRSPRVPRVPVLLDRRAVAVLWDLGTFRPRTVHPFAPPCYAARAVPELAKRITGLAARGPVVISGHRRGSVLAAATILRLPPSVLARVSLPTYGSPLRRTYARLDPAYLWRDTDPIGGPIFPQDPDGPLGDVDRRLRDPRSLTIEPADTVPPPIERHWPYHTQAAYQRAVHELIDRSR
ncbi:hypothetical protein [Micromonospora sp. WMMD964]|uniref:hypothetical protein n=1 Tax=Micromonospora sp. WMMD964 TaxID=3016091 RepID=UPI0032B5DA7C